MCEHINLFMSNSSVPEMATDFIFLHCYWHTCPKPAQVIVGIVTKDVKEPLGKMLPDLPGIFNKFLSCFFQSPACPGKAKKMLPLSKLKTESFEYF